MKEETFSHLFCYNFCCPYCIFFDVLIFNRSRRKKECCNINIEKNHVNKKSDKTWSQCLFNHSFFYSLRKKNKFDSSEKGYSSIKKIVETDAENLRLGQKICLHMIIISLYSIFWLGRVTVWYFSFILRLYEVIQTNLTTIYLR